MADRQAWRAKGSCSGLDPSPWFPEKKGRNNSPIAYRICAECPVKRQCLAFAVAYDERGIWGGYSERARRILLKSNPFLKTQLADLIQQEVPWQEWLPDLQSHRSAAPQDEVAQLLEDLEQMVRDLSPSDSQAA